MSKPDLLVAPCSHKAAKFAVMNWHYTKSLPVPPRITTGVWEDGVFVGAVIFSRGSNNNMGKPYNLKLTEICELTRIALNVHSAFVSQIVAMCIRAVRSQSPGLRLVVSYADPNNGHHGGIYQAGNWIYTGSTGEDFKAIDGTGREWHSRQVSKTGVSRQFGELRKVPKFDDCEIIKLAGKHRYLYPLDKAMRRQIEPLALPYPKRANVGEVESRISTTD